ncbi:hypothetical protein B296_00045571, partial [Ensete ventricosum]
LGKKPARHASFSYPRDRRRFSLRSTEKPTDDESGSGEQRQISRFLPFLLPLLLSPSANTTRNRSPMVEIDRYRSTAVGDGRNQPLLPDSGRRRSKSTVTTRQRPATIKIDRYQPISGGNGAETAPIGDTTR